jgi:hypothetical protein
MNAIPDLEERVAVTMWVETMHEGGCYFHHSAHLSTDSIRFGNTVPPQAGTEVQIEFTLPGDRDPIWLQGVVVDDDGHGQGMLVRFGHRDARTHARLRAFVERALRRAACETRELDAGARASR